ncbi:putative amino acid transporter, transmembrane domain-containing protein [Helianthus annuus]|nr:putative amino acid transporter, transmembrane domain-containing protein [Helianthus annuus]
MSELGWGPGVAVLVISWVVTLYTLWQMVEMHEMVPGKRFDRYHELGQHAFGEKLGLYIVVPQQLVVEVGPPWIRVVQPDVEYGYKAKSTVGTVFNFFSALGDVAFAYAGHNVVLEIQATIPSTPEKPSKVALIGYWVYGNGVDDNILVTLEKPTWLIAMANMFVVVHVIGSYQIYAMPVFDMMETVLVKKVELSPRVLCFGLSRGISFTMFIGICFPFFSGLLGFFGGFAFAPTTYFLPCIMWLSIYKPKRWSLSWITNWICIVLGVALMIVSPIGGLRSIIVQAKTYKFFS